MRCYGLRAALFAGALCGVRCCRASLGPGWSGRGRQRAAGRPRVDHLLYSERTVLTALRARPVSEVERPDLYWLVRDLASAARLPVPRLFVSPGGAAEHPDRRDSPRSVAVCCTEGLLRLLSPASCARCSRTS